jgi:hypothetical protein
MYLTGPDHAGVYLGDAAELAAGIPDESVDLIFTDPPYDRDSIPLYGLVAEIGARVLKPGGFLLAMAGGLYADQHLALMSKHMAYFWTLHVQLTGRNTGSVHPGGNPIPIVTRVKPIYAFVKGWGSPRTVVYDPFGGSGNDKRYHRWGQDFSSARYYIDCFSREGDLVLDLFCGGGTTPAVCKYLSRRWLAFDVDAAAVAKTMHRLENYQLPLFVPELVIEQATLPIGD